MKFLFLGLLGLGVGTVSGMVGIGGGVLLVPALTELFAFDQRKAAGMTLAVLCVPVTLPAVWQYYTQGHLTLKDLGMAAAIAGAFAIGTFSGAYLQNLLKNVHLLRLGFGLLMVYVAVRMIVYSSSETVNTTAGLAATGLAWAGYLYLRALGRRHAPRPDLGEQIRRQAEENRRPDEYYI